MISIQAKKHDNFSAEFKIGYNCKEQGDKDKFSVNTWIFVPNSLDINPENYGKKQFYRDIKSNVRLITPVYPLRDIAQYTSLPFVSLRKAIENVVSDPSKSSPAESPKPRIPVLSVHCLSAIRAEEARMYSPIRRS